MAQNVGEIIISTEIDNKEVKKKLDELKTLMEKGGKDASKEYSDEVNKLSESYNKLVMSQEKSNDKLKEYGEQLEFVASERERMSDIAYSLREEADLRDRLIAEGQKENAILLDKREMLKSINQQIQDNQVSGTTDTNEHKQLISERTTLNQEIEQSEVLLQQANNELEKSTQNTSELKSLMDDINNGIKNVDTEKIAKGIKNTNIRLEESKIGMSALDRSVRNTRDKMTGVSTEASKSSRNIKDMDKATRQTTASTNKLQDASSKVGKTVGMSVKSMLKWAGAMFGIRTAYNAIRKTMNAWLQDTQEGMQAQAQLAGIWSSLGNVLGPIFQWLINLLSTMLGYVNAITTALFGFQVFTAKAGKNLDKATGSAKKLNKEMKTLAGFDEANVLPSPNDNSGGGGGGGGATIEPIEIPTPNIDKFIQAFEKMKKAIQPFIDIIKSIDFEPARKSLIKFANAVKSRFEIIGASIARVMNETLGPFIKMLMEDIVPKWLDTFTNMIERLNPILDKFLKEVIEPIFHWFMLDFVPVGLDFVLATLDLIQAVFTLVLASFTEFWNLIGEPIAWVLGELISAILQDLTVAFEVITDSIDFFLEKLAEGDPLAQALAFSIGLIVTALGLWKAGALILKGVQLALNGVIAIFNMLLAMNPIMLVILAIAALIAIIIVLWANWEAITEFFKETIKQIGEFFGKLGDKISETFKKAIDFVKQKWQDFKDWINNSFIEPIKNAITGMWDNLKQGAKDAWQGVKDTFGAVGKFFGDVFGNAWKKVKDVFSTGGKIFDGIKDGIVSAFTSVVNAIIDGINKVVSIPFNAINNALGGLRGISILGAKPFGWLPTISVPRIPRLATGTYTNGAMTAMIGENGREAVVPLQNNTEWIHDFIDLFNANDDGSGSGQTIVNKLVVDGKTLAEIVNKINRAREFATNGRGMKEYA